MLRIIGLPLKTYAKSLSLVRCFAQESSTSTINEYPKERYFGDNTGWIIPISPSHNICWQNKVLIDIRKFFRAPDSEKMLPTQKGISLNEQQWRALVDSIKQVDECLADMNERVKDLPPVTATYNSNGYRNNRYNGRNTQYNKGYYNNNNINENSF